MAGTDERRTPLWLFERLHLEFVFDLDVGATADNHLLPTWVGPGGIADDALQAPWAALGARIFCNPPYSRGQLRLWLQAARKAQDNGATVVLLLPADTSTSWFHEYCVGERTELRFLRGRLAFEGAPLTKDGRLAPAKFANVVVVLRPWVTAGWVALTRR